MILSDSRHAVPTMLLLSMLSGLLFSPQGMAQTTPGIERVDNSTLPSGNGLAARFTSDAKLTAHPSVIFSDDFETGELGERWDEANDRNGNVLSFADPASKHPGLGQRSLKVTATLGQNSGGGLTKWFESADRLFLRFYTKFDPDCDYVHHFCTLRANKSLRGGDRWSGFGGAGELPAGDARFSTAIEPWGNWGKWICVEFMIAHNTPGQDDGEQAYWIDGELRGHWRGISWRTSPTLMANAFTLESYVTDRWTQQRVNIVYFDNVVIAKEYIGPLARP
ncbi:MAG: hypothetical protein ACF788_02850 [Novipirellula sp. JB048]